MLASSTNAALGFFGWPLDISDYDGEINDHAKYRQVVMIEHDRVCRLWFSALRQC
jgi:hypothetical protein